MMNELLEKAKEFLKANPQFNEVEMEDELHNRVRVVRYAGITYSYPYVVSYPYVGYPVPLYQEK